MWGYWPWIVSFVAWLAAILASRAMARRKNRTQTWAFFTLCFAPCLLVLWLLPVLPQSQPQAESPETDGMGKTEKFGVSMLLAALLLALIVATYHDALPSCDSEDARKGIDAAVADAPLGKTFGLKITAMTDMKTISTSADHLACRANVTLSNATRHVLEYWLYRASGQTMIGARIID
jgi:hypothetical protein